MMTAEEYRAALAALDLSQADAAKLLEVDERTSRRWALGERSIPGPVSLALQLMQGQQPKTDLERQKREVESYLYDKVASQRWHDLKAAERLIRQLTEALKGLHYVVVSDPAGVPNHLKKDLRRAEKVLEIVASVKRAKRS